MVNSIIETIQNHGWTAVGVVTLISAFIEFTPIKFNPLSWVGKQIKKGLGWVGKQMTGELSEEIKETQNDLKEHLKQADERFAYERKKRDMERMKTLRWEILDFGNSVKTKTYRKEAFDHIFEDYEEYKELIKENKLVNGQTDRAMAFVSNVYNERQNDPDF